MYENNLKQTLTNIRGAIEQKNLALIDEKDRQYICENVYQEGIIDYELVDYKPVVQVADNHPGKDDKVYRFLRDLYADIANDH